jgi:GTP-binding protein HflX
VTVKTREKAVLAALRLPTQKRFEVDESLDELGRLAESAGAEVVGRMTQDRPAPTPGLYFGRGKVDELRDWSQRQGANLMISDDSLSPIQERNLGGSLNMKVIDRTALILDIFAQRARSHEGKLQVELAQLEHLSTRLVRGWTHLERQKGGIGLRGPGEKQLETDRRLLGNRVKLLKLQLAQLAKQRKVRRRARERRELLSVSLVGYTNAGKSTLFNALTKAGSYAADQLFATLDTTSRRLYVDGETVVLSDTVGFIRDLPHALVAAFRATLEETVQADLLLHVVDAASEDRDAQIAAVNQVLDEIGAADVEQILVWNKIDLTHAAAAVERGDCDRIGRVFLSARTGEGLALLREVLAQAARRGRTEHAGRIDGPADGLPIQT